MAQATFAARSRSLAATVLQHSDLIVSTGAVLVVGMLVVPMPHWLLDGLLVANIALTLTVLLVTAYNSDAMQFSVFPSLLLVATLFRLALNISATRLILLHADAGTVISAFGHFVVGGNYVVGIVVFLILVIIQFVVITNGAGRVAEVAARFTLDAMPGKQMAIDADLNAGLIDELQARARREAVAREADFYGAMDGASKFVRGDAIAAVVMILVNILGGFIIGLTQRGFDLMTALQTYTLLTVGEGLVTQIPALLMSTATGLIVTRASSAQPLGQDLTGQLLGQPRVMTTVAAMLALMALVPGLPKLPFLSVAALVGLVAFTLPPPQPTPSAEEAAHTASLATAGPEQIADLLVVDPIELEIGYGLIPLADPAQGGTLLERITVLRRHVAAELGFIVPPLRVRDNMDLPPNHYAIALGGARVAEGDMYPRQLLAMNPGGATAPLRGLETKEPAFGLPALWIAETQKTEAEIGGYSVVDAPTVLITHLGEVIRRHADEILSRQDTQALLDTIRRSTPVVVDELVPKLLSLSEVHRVLQGLLRERVSIRDLARLLSVLADYAPATRDPEQLVEYARRGLARTITAAHLDAQGMLQVFTLDPTLEELLITSVRQTTQGPMPVPEPQVARSLLESVATCTQQMIAAGLSPVLLCSPQARRPLRKFLEQVLPELNVISHAEVAPGTRVQSAGVVSLPQLAAAEVRP